MLVVLVRESECFTIGLTEQKNAGQMGVFAGTERQCAEDEHDDYKDENDSQTSEFGFNYPSSGYPTIWPKGEGL